MFAARPRILRRIHTTAILLLILAMPCEAASQKSTGPAAGRGPTGALKVVTGRPGSVVFINNIRHGATDESGSLDLPRVKAGSYPVRVRTAGYVDWRGSVSVAPGASRVLKVSQQPTTDQALLHYQNGEALRDAGKNEEAVKEYKKAVELRPVFPEARVAMVRSLITLQDFAEAESQIQAALKQHKGAYPEGQTVLANMRRNQGLIEESIVEYRKALRLARGVSPEAHIGLAIALEEMNLLDEAIKEYRAGIAQDMDTEPILYYLLGSALEKRQRFREAIDAYRNYLRLDPEGQYASAVESIIERLKEEIDR